MAHAVALRAYTQFVIAVGAVLLAAVLATGLLGIGERHTGAFLLFAPLVVVFELLPIRVKRREGDTETTVSTTFTFTLLLTSGPAAAMLAHAFGSLLADATRRKETSKALFNVSQYAIAIGGAALTLRAVAGYTVIGPRVVADEVPAVLLAAAAFFAITHLASAVRLALGQDTQLVWALRRDLLFHVFTTGGLLLLAPIVVAAVDDTMLLAPILLLPMGAVYVCAATLVAKDHEALHDPLTDLPNRAYFREVTEGAIDQARRAGSGIAVMLIDLDQFKQINDTLGHHEGDGLLQQIGPRLQQVLRSNDVIARLGGDEFGVLLCDVQGEAAAMEVADRMLEVLEQHFELPEVVLDIDASIGIALYPEHGDDVATLLQRADVAMYLAKDDRTGYQVYTVERDPHSAKKLSLLHDLRRALEDEQFLLYYQPKASLGTGRVLGVEGLIRWNHPTEGLLNPDTFIPLAESSGLSRPLTIYLLQRGLSQIRAWRDQGFELSLALNLTVRNLHDPAFPLDVARELEKWELPASSLKLEITEGIVMADIERVLGVLQALRDIGVELALDDYGTGLSSLSYLKKLPVHELKIDKSFVTSMCDDESDAVIVRSTIDLARNLGLRTVAEGVEDERTWAVLAELGCDQAQGYFLSRAMPPHELTGWLRAYESRSAELSRPYLAVVREAFPTGG